MDKARKKQTRKIINWVSMALVVALLAAMPLMAKREIEEDGPVASILSGTLEKGTITSVLRGGGTLQIQGAEDVKLTEGVKITEFLVKNGDKVSKGDPVALVDQVSVMTAIVQVRESMDYLQKEIESARNEKVSGTISATAGGRVKQVFAQSGDKVQDVMLEHGALAVLSLDSLMAVKIERSLPLTTGDSVVVVLEDGTEAEGRVESNLEGVTVITVEDKGYAIGEAVSVKTENGEDLGAGLLYVHNAWKATAFTGTVSAVYAKEEKEVYSGSTLFTLTDTDFTAQLEYMSDQHREYQDLMQELFQMYESGCISAPCSGVVSGVDEDSAFLLSGGPIQWQAVPLAAKQENSYQVILLSSETPSEPAGGTGGDSGESGEGEDSESTTVPGTTYIAFAAMVKEVGSNGLILKKSNVPGTAVKTETTDEEGNVTSSWTYSEGLLDPTMMLTTEVLPVEDPSAYLPGDLLVFLYDENYNPVEMIKAGNIPQTGTGTGGFPGGFPSGIGGFDISGILGSMMGGMGGMTGSAGAAQEEPQLYNLEGTTLLTVTPQDTVELSITLDEQDISSVAVGMTAQVKVEALKGQVFEAEVVQVGISGSNNGGSSKFPVKLRLSWGENMLDGMSASASIPLYEKQDILLIPVKALSQLGGRTVVYTALNPETGEPENPVEVTTGISDGENAEVLAGLHMGDSYYYSYYDILELDTAVNTQKYTFG